MRFQGKKRRAVDPVIATLLLIAIAVAAAIIVYFFVTGLIGGLSTGAGSSLVTISGGISVPTGGGSGVLTLTVRNGASNPISAILLKSLDNAGTDYYCPASSADANCATKTDPTLTWTPLALPVGSSASTLAAYSPCNVAAGFTSGNTYTALIQVTFSTGSIAVLTYDITAQL